jgi:hypothetical protein
MPPAPWGIKVGRAKRENVDENGRKGKDKEKMISK